MALTDGAGKIILEGSVDPKFIRDLEAVAEGLAHAREEGEKVGRVRAGSGFEDLRQHLAGAGERARGFAAELRDVATAAAGTVAVAAGLTAGFLALASAGDRNVRALNGLGGSFDAVARSTNNSVDALSAYRAQQTLVNSGLRISGEELATVARHAREHRDVTKSAEEALQEFTEALRNGESEGLRKYGIAVEQGATRAQTFESALRQMREAAEGANPAAQTLGESLTTIQTGAGEAATGLAAMAAQGLGLDNVVSNLARDIADLGRNLTELAARRQTVLRDANASRERQAMAEDYRRNFADVADVARAQGLQDLLPQANVSGLSDEQFRAAAATLASIRAETDRLRRTSARDVRLAPGAADTSITPQSATGPNLATGAGLNAADNAIAALRAARAGGAPANDDARQLLETRLRALQGEIREGLEAGRAQGPRDRAAAPAATAAPAAARGGGAAAANDNAARMTPEEQRRLAAGLSPLGGALAGAIDTAAAPFDGDVEALRRAQEQERALTAAQNQRAETAAAAGRARTQPLIDRVGTEQERDKQRSEDFRAQEIHQRAIIERENAYLEERLRVQESFSEQWERVHRRQANATTASVEIANTAVTKFGQAFGQHVNLILSGQESVGEGVLNMVSDVVTALGQEAIVKAAMETAEGVAAAAGVYTAPLAPGHFAAAAAFAAVGAAALGAGALIGAARGGSASATPAAPALPPPTQADAAASQGQSITIVYGAGILGSPRDLARHVRDVLVEGEQGGVRLPARVMEAA